MMPYEDVTMCRSCRRRKTRNLKGKRCDKCGAKMKVSIKGNEYCGDACWDKNRAIAPIKNVTT